MAQIEVLLPGYPGVHDAGVFGFANCCLITSDDGKRIITDPGHPGRARYLYDQLQKRKLDPLKDIDIVFIEELHWDHFLNYEMFVGGKARIMAPKEDWDWLAGMKQYQPRMSKHSANNLKEDGVELINAEGHLAKGVDIIRVVGHTPGHTALVVKTAQGTACVCSDVIHNARAYLTEHEPIVTMGGTQAQADAAVKKVKQLANPLIVYPGHDVPFIGRGNRVEFLAHSKMVIQTFSTETGRNIQTTIEFSEPPKEGL
jgi:glyoxylase-like metal-dependent hydrolase (beta-lactamase superfamily II)